VLVSLHLLLLEYQLLVLPLSPSVAVGSGQSTSSPNTVVGQVPEDAVSLQEGGGSFYDSTLREVWINGFNDFPMEDEELLYQMFMAANPEANMYTSGSISFATHQSRLEKELKRPPIQEVFDKTHKKKGTDQYISDRAQEVTECYNQHMTEKYVGEEEQPQLDLEVWVAAFGAPKKGHVYGFGHSMDTSSVLSVASSSASQSSAFTTPAVAPGTSLSEMMGFIADTISGLESHLAETLETHLAETMETHMVQTMETRLAVQAYPSQAISQALSQVSIPPREAPSTSAQAPHVSKLILF
ncbi:hypothetical protein Taro_027357, partial [Colocasia esculenta]|nr:hypothetical protein [Colocasia esculenta]